MGKDIPTRVKVDSDTLNPLITALSLPIISKMALSSSVSFASTPPSAPVFLNLSIFKIVAHLIFGHQASHT
uniref:Uncharacterized protein n=1 Tax=Romanomermis culicivorax TaxID=13658 RepID=A0A915JQC3_ROMCU